jgi:hypothetical protein
MNERLIRDAEAVVFERTDQGVKIPLGTLYVYPSGQVFIRIEGDPPNAIPTMNLLAAVQVLAALIERAYAESRRAQRTQSRTDKLVEWVAGGKAEDVEDPS